MPNVPKLRVGWFTFTCCEDSTIMFTEILNKYYTQWLPRLNFVHARVLRRDDTHEIQPMDVAFIEGAISSDDQEAKLKDIRAKSTKIVAIGSCACVGSPSNQRNFFTRENYEEIKPILEKFKYKEKVLKVSDVVVVDEQVPGCPMNEVLFIKLMNMLLKQSEKSTDALTPNS